MFRDEYKNAVDGIKADGFIKQKVLRKIEEKQKKKYPSKAVVFRLGGVLAACAAILLSVWVIKPFDGKIKINEETKNESTVTYDEIYSIVKEFKPKENIFYDAITLMGGSSKSNAMVEEYSYATEADSVNDINGGSAASKDDSYSETTAQVEGVGESDIVKTDGKYIYSFSYNKGTIRIIRAGKSPEKVSEIKVASDSFNPESEMYLYKNRLVILGYNGSYAKAQVKAIIYDVTNPENPEKLYECCQSGGYSSLWNNSRLIGDKLYIISNYTVNFDNFNKNKPETYIPSIECSDYNSTVSPETVYINEVCNSPQYTVISAFSVTDGKLISTQSLLGGTYALYCSTENIITAGYSEDGKTAIARFSIDNGIIELKSEGEINGNLLNQFSIDEYKGNFRFVTTVYGGKETRSGDIVRYEPKNSNSLVVLNGDLKEIGKIENIAPDERVYSVRFMGDVAYFVTFRQVDPLFSVDLSNPENPKIIGALKIPGFSNYLFPYGEGKLLGIGQDADEKTGRTGGVKLSMFDISNPADVTEGAKQILEANYSEALSSHKAILINKDKNLIAFSVYGKQGAEYKIFSFKNSGFTEKASIKLNNVDYGVRGIYIGSEFYIVAENQVLVLDLTDFTKLSEINIK